MSNGNSADLNNAIRIEIQRIIQSLNDTIPDTPPPPLRTNTAPHENTMYIQFLETIAHDYNQNIREYQSNIRCIFQILYELLVQQRQRQRPVQETAYTLPSYTNRSQQYYQTDHSQRFPRTGSRPQPTRSTPRSFREPTLTQILQNLSFRPTTQRRQPTAFQDVIVRPTPDQISSAVNRFRYDTTLQLRNTNCPITLEDFQEGDPLMQIVYCQHCFHEHALENWFQQNVRCPVCRYDIRVSTERPRSFRSDAPANASTDREHSPENNEDLPSEHEQEEEEEGEETAATSDSQSRIFFRGNVESSPNSHPLAQTFFNGLSEEFTNILNEYMNQANVSIPRDISENQIYRFEIPIYYNEYYDGSDNLIGIEPVD